MEQLRNKFETQIDKAKEHRLPAAVYPLRGFAHFLRHPQRHAGPIVLSILKVLATSSVVVYPLYRFTYHYQHDMIASFYRSSHIIKSPYFSTLFVTVTSSILFFLETSAVTLQLAGHFIGNIRNRLFDSVLKERKGLPSSETNIGEVTEKVAGGVDETSQLVEHHRFLSPMDLMITSAQTDDSWAILLLRPAVFVMTLPLNIIPIVGPFCFISIQALFRGGMAHRRYFQLYNWSSSQRQRRMETYFWQYQRFGMVATALEMIPFVGYLFMYTNQIG